MADKKGPKLTSEQNTDWLGFKSEPKFHYLFQENVLREILKSGNQDANGRYAMPLVLSCPSVASVFQTCHVQEALEDCRQ